MQNPFIYGGIVTGPHFADRGDEIAELLGEVVNTNRVFLVSPRRYGKTCLLFNLMQRLDQEDIASAYIDLYAFPDLRSLAGAAASITTKALESNSDRLLKFFSGFTRLRPQASIGPDGNVQMTLELAAEEKNALPALIEAMAGAEALAAKKNRKLLVIIDEFSDIGKYNAGTVEKALRSEVQRHRQVGYIFAGSEQSVMLSMVQDSKRAFYKMGRIMTLGPIKASAYCHFIMNWFETGGYRISTETAAALISIGENVPYNVQRLCHTAWEEGRESKHIDMPLVEQLPAMIANQDAAHYEMIWQTITASQRTLLIALGKDPQGLPFSRDFQLQHKIGPSSSIKASLDSLQKKGVLFKTIDNRYRFVDLFLPYWIAQIRRR